MGVFISGGHWELRPSKFVATTVSIATAVVLGTRRSDGSVCVFGFVEVAAAGERVQFWLKLLCVVVKWWYMVCDMYWYYRRTYDLVCG